MASLEICRQDLRDRDETYVSMRIYGIYVYINTYLVDKKGSKSLSADTAVALISAAIRPF